MANEQGQPDNPADELFQRALDLAPDVRVELADRLYQSVEPEDATDEWDPAFLAELEERVARYERGETQARDAFEALAELRRKYSVPPPEQAT
jgi:outer membrane protein assembly factor BamD (BamD/ComL family)